MFLLWFLPFVSCAFAYGPEENMFTYDPDLFEGDMIFTPVQKWAAMTGGDVDQPLGRGSIQDKRWPRGVMLYEIDSTLANNPTAMAAIKSGMEEWTSKTCIQFKKRTNEASYVTFGLGRGCASFVGRKGGKQNIRLASGCWRKGIVAHEIGHALGFYHEQSRPDRDDYVTIQWENIKGNFRRQFKKYTRTTIDSLGTKYDYGSVMHYRSVSFSKNGKPTIVPKQSGVKIGQREKISAIDAQQMNLLYKSECSARKDLVEKHVTEEILG